MQAHVYVVIVIAFISNIYATWITTIVHRDESGDYFNTSESCSSYSAKEHTIEETCICRKANPTSGGMIGGTFLSECQYDFTSTEACTMSLLNGGVPYYLKSALDLAQITPLSLDRGKTAITTSQCKKLTLNANDVWDTVEEKWVGFLFDRFEIVQSGINYVIAWVDNVQPNDNVWKREYKGGAFRLKITCQSDSSTTRNCLVIKVKGDKAYEIPGPPEPTTTTTTTTTTTSTATTTTTQATPSTTTPVIQTLGPKQDDGSDDIGAIVGSIIGVMIGVILIFILLCFLHKGGIIKISPIVDRIPHSKTRKYFQDRNGEEKQRGCQLEREPTAIPNPYNTEKLSKDVESGVMASEEELTRMRVLSQSSFSSFKPLVTPTKSDEFLSKETISEEIYEEIPDPEKEQKKEDSYSVPEKSPMFRTKHSHLKAPLSNTKTSVKSNSSTESGWSLNEFDDFSDDDRDKTDGATDQKNSYLKAGDTNEILNELKLKHTSLPDLPDIKNEALPDLPSIKNNELPQLPNIKNDKLPELPKTEADHSENMSSMKNPINGFDNNKDLYIDFNSVDSQQKDTSPITRPSRSLQDGNQVEASSEYKHLDDLPKNNNNYQGLSFSKGSK